MSHIVVIHHLVQMGRISPSITPSVISGTGPAAKPRTWLRCETSTSCHSQALIRFRLSALLLILYPSLHPLRVAPEFPAAIRPQPATCQLLSAVPTIRVTTRAAQSCLAIPSWAIHALLAISLPTEGMSRWSDGQENLELVEIDVEDNDEEVGCLWEFHIDHDEVLRKQPTSSHAFPGASCTRSEQTTGLPCKLGARPAAKHCVCSLQR